MKAAANSGVIAMWLSRMLPSSTPASAVSLYRGLQPHALNGARRHVQPRETAQVEGKVVHAGTP